MEETRSESAGISGLIPDALRMPATGLTCVAAIAVTAICWTTENFSGIEIDARGFFHSLWTPITSALAHVGALHLIFNLVWLWRFGGWLEHRVGSIRTMLLYCVLAIASAAAEYARNYGGVGLSGVVYGLFGLLWLRRHVDREAARILDRNTLILFVGWFFLCILLTATNVYPVGNVAHFGGAIAGAGVGWAWNREGMRRRVAVVVLCTGFVLVLESATVGRFLVNRGPGLSLTYTLRGETAMGRADYPAALSLCQRAVEQDPTNGYARWHLGTAQVMSGSESLGLESLREAARLGVRTDTPERVWIEWMNFHAHDCLKREDWTAIDRVANEMIGVDEKCVDAWNWSGHAAMRDGRLSDGCSAFERAFDLDADANGARDNQVWAKLTRARLALETSDIERAKREVETGLALAPGDAALTKLKLEIAQKSPSGR